MKWSQVDLIARIVRLDVGTTKNKEGRIPPLQVGELYETIAMLKAERYERFPECPLVFTRNGQPIKEFRTAWDSACKASGQWDVVTNRHTRILHDLRRTGVRNLVRAGVPEKVAMMIPATRRDPFSTATTSWTSVIWSKGWSAWIATAANGTKSRRARKRVSRGVGTL